MPKPPNPLWGIHKTMINPAVATGSGNKEWKCNYCGEPFVSSATRLILHVSGLGGRGIGGCTSVPFEIAWKVIKDHPKLCGGPSTMLAALQDEDLLGPESHTINLDDTMDSDSSALGSSHAEKRSRKEGIAFATSSPPSTAMATSKKN